MNFIGVNLTSSVIATALLIGIWWMEWPSIRDRRTKFLFGAILLTAWVIACTVAANIKLPGPPQLLDAIFRPLLGAFETTSRR